ncbi:hypothetical protein AB0892_23405 [Streptomyces sp. NPDC005409]|uniref:hypothetical protein n=1 Tax=Streptomyces sp. NPDC005409 TaxID=3155342 RepID=UPI0034544FE3
MVAFVAPGLSRLLFVLVLLKAVTTPLRLTGRIDPPPSPSLSSQLPPVMTVGSLAETRIPSVVELAVTVLVTDPARLRVAGHG